MIKTSLVKPFIAISVASLLLVGCGGGSSSDSIVETIDEISSYSVEGVIVDPYIVGAVLCEDVNKDATCGENEQTSSISTQNGVFSFDSNLTVGSHIIVKTQGMHEGKMYDLDISGVVANDGTIDIVSPLTTFETKGLTTAQIAEILNNAASTSGVSGWNLTSDDIKANPISDGLLEKTISEVTQNDLVNIQASLASYGILKIMSGSEALSALSSIELYTSGMSGELYEISKVMIKHINSALNTTTLNQIKAGIDQGRNAVSAYIPQGTAKAGLPEPTIELIVKVAVSIIDRLAEIGYTTCNASGGDVNAALNEVANNQSQIVSSAMDLGTQMYGLTYRNEMKNNFSGAYSAVLNGIFSFDSNMQIGYNAGENGYTTIRFDSSNNLVAQ